MIDEFEDREILGTVSRFAGASRDVTVQEEEEFVMVSVGLCQTRLNTDQAKKIARHLNRIARRIEARLEA